MDNANWLNDEIRRGLSKLVCLCLDGAPSADLIEGTAQAWLTAITHGLVWDEARDRQRFRDGFDVLLAHCSRWPIPRELLNALPQPTQPRIEHDRRIPETRDARVRRLRDILGDSFNPDAIEAGDLGVQR